MTCLQKSERRFQQVNYTSNFAEALEMSKNSMANILLNDEDPAEVLKAEQEEMKAKFGK